jgi:hypothetical protein
MKILASLVFLSLISLNVFANNEDGPFICACENVSNYTEAYSQLVVQNLKTGKSYKLGKFVGESGWRAKSLGEATDKCVQAISVQSICTQGYGKQE